MNIWLILIFTVVSSLYALLKFKSTYWQQKGVPQLSDGVWGNIRRLTSIHNADLWQEVYDRFKGKSPLAGTYIYTRPFAVILDLDLVKHVLIKDFHSFTDRFTNPHSKDILNQHLFNADSTIWKGLRMKLTPTFTSGKMRFMFPSLVEVSQQYVETLQSELQEKSDGILEMYDWNGRFTTDVIGSVIFGIKTNSIRNPNAEFRQIGQKAFGADRPNIKWSLAKNMYMKYLKYVGIRRFNPILERFFLRIVNDTVLERERRNIHRNDFIDILIELKNQKDENGQPVLSLELVAAQLFVFFVAGFETSSSNMSYGLYELAKNPEKQDILRQEIVEVLKKHNNQLTYEAMMEMSYLDQVISETLRLHPALAILQRVCMEDYQVPDTDIVLEKGTAVAIPVQAIHYDPEIYENPSAFIPERFEHNEVQSRHPQSFLGFGDGPRNCIGLRFGRMQAKVGLISLISNFRFSVCHKTPQHLECSNYSFVLIPGKGVWLKVDKL
ncbi:cytochrome P450 6a2-like [Musca vetustissima]|uniref:cytochrome P450 6a2-like n=1 Tax=Musca vetustissima TaxID=27455 RepID=UPI002AB7057D|nr:cytochrome P450 6a2-like [Musca vetustissima]